MHALRRAYRGWHVRRTILLSVATAAVFYLIVAQALRWRENPAVYGVAVLVTAQIGMVLAYLLARHVRRQAPRESSTAAILGVAVAIVLTLGAPTLAEREAPPHREIALAFPTAERADGTDAVPRAPERLRPPAPETAERPRSVEKPEPSKEPAKTVPVEPGPVTDTGGAPKRQDPPWSPLDADAFETPFVDYHKLMQERAQSRDQLFEQELRELMRSGLPSERDPEALPDVHASASAFFGHVRGGLGMGTGSVDTDAPLDQLLGSGTFETGAELMADFPLSPRQVLRVSALGVLSEEEGLFDAPVDVGGAVAVEGTPYEFTMQWAHAFVGFSHRFAGYRAESQFDFSVHLGAVFEHISAELTTPFGSATVVDDDGAWAAPTVGFQAALYDFAGGSLQVELLQSIPLNIGGQTAMVTDVRFVVQYELTTNISLVLGYRKVYATLRSFEDSFGQAGSSTHSRFDVGGPLVGLDVRF